MVYIFATLTSVTLAHFSNYINNSCQITNGNKKMIVFFLMMLSFLPLASIMAVRYNVGTDYMGYWRGYYYQNALTTEMGFQLVERLLYNISVNPQFFFAVSSIFICGVFFKTAYKESINPAYSILLFVINMDYFASMNGVRQYISTMICLLGLPYIINRDWIKSLAIVSIACLFHQSAIVFFFLFIFYSIEISPLKGCITIVALQLIIGNNMRDLIFPIIQKYTRFGGYFLLTSQYNNSNIEIGNLLIYLSFFLFLSYEYNNVKKSKELKLLYVAVFLGILIIISGEILPRIVSRMAWHMNSILAIYLPKAINSLHRKNVKIILSLLIVICYTLVCIQLIYIKGYHEVLPYQFFWNAVS